MPSRRLHKVDLDKVDCTIIVDWVTTLIKRLKISFVAVPSDANGDENKGVVEVVARR